MKKLYTAFSLLLLILICTFGAIAQDTPGTVKFPGAVDSQDSLIRAANGANTSLTASVTSSSTTLTVGSTSAFPASGALIIDAEVIFYTSKTATTFTGLVRGADSTTAAAHNSGASVRGALIAGFHNTLASAVIATQNKVGAGSSTPSIGAVLVGTGLGTSSWNTAPTINCSNCTGITGATGGVSNAASTTFVADNDANGTGTIDEQIGGDTKRRLENDGETDLIGGLSSYAKAGLPAAANAGRLARVTDSRRGIHVDSGSQWIDPSLGLWDVRWYGAKDDRTTSVATNNTAIQSAINAFPAGQGGSILIPRDTRWNISGVTVPNYTTIFDYSGYYPADDPGFNAGFTAGPRIYLMGDVESPPDTNAGNAFSVLSKYHPALTVNNISGGGGGANRRASFILQQDGVTKWQIGKGVQATDDHFHISNYAIDPGGTTIFALDNTTGALALNASSADAGASFDMHTRIGDFIGIFNSKTTSDDVDLRFYRADTSAASNKLMSILASADASHLISFYNTGDSGSLGAAIVFRPTGIANPQEFQLMGYGAGVQTVVFSGGSEAVRYTTSQKMKLTSGVVDGGGMKHQRVTTGSISAGARADVTLTWTTAFADTNYTVQCTVLDTSGAGTGLRFERLRSLSATAIIAQVINDAGGSLTGTLHCTAIHD